MTVVDVDLLRSAATGLGVDLCDREVEALVTYAGEMVSWNQRVNLTRITDPAGIAVQHLADSLAVLRFVGAGSTGHEAPSAPSSPTPCASADGGALSLVDVGSGAGLPGIPLAVVCPDVAVTLVESVGRKTAFLEHVVRVLGLARVTILHARAEDAGRDEAHRERHDVAVGRAVAALPVLAEYLVPLLAVGGRMVVHRGADGPREADEAAGALRRLGAALVAVERYELPGVRDPRHVVVAEKVRPTPPDLPRRAGLPERRALR